MSRTIRKQLFSTLNTLQKANKMLPKLFQRDEQQLVELLMQCQNCAIEIGNQIESVYGTDLESIHELEEYCEALYQISLHAEAKAERTKEYETSRQILERLCKTMEKELPDRLEVVFLPYKSSMWDSLESVWMAAKEHEECDAYVIPIPYFDKNPDGSFKEEHYEGDLYPDYVPITKYDEYDIEKRRPDMIFIHNPYDKNNNVTSVHPFFYSKNLKQYTECLVYIPYYVVGDSVYNNFAVSSGAIHADIVAVQSKRVAEKYNKIYKDTLGEYIKNSSDKFYPLGSPKFDQIFHSVSKPILPTEWEEKIQNKTVVLYNTGISGTLMENEHQLNKIKDTINYFSKRNDIILWWRPHPLSMATFLSMRPQFYNEYVKVVQKFKDDNIGIFDDTSDLNRAILSSDLYYGDDSSVLHLYGCTGKPIVLQNTMVQLSDDCDLSVAASSIYADDKFVWFTAETHNGFYKIDKASMQCEFIASIPNEEGTDYLYSDILEYDNKLWLIPRKALEIAVFDLVTLTFSKIPLPEACCLIGKKFSSAMIVNGNLVMMPDCFPGILIYHISEGNFSVNTRFAKKLGVELCSVGVSSKISKICTNGDKGWFALSTDEGNSGVYEAIMDDRNNLLVNKITDIPNVRHIAFGGEALWIAQSDNIIKYNVALEKEESYSIDRTKFDGYIDNIIFCNDSLWVIPYSGSTIVKIPANLEVQQIKYISCSINIRGNAVCRYNETTIALHTNNKLTNSKIHLVYGEDFVQSYSLNVNDRMRGTDYLTQREIAPSIIARDYTYVEHAGMTLDDILNCNHDSFISHNQIEKYKELSGYADISAGKRIFEAAKKIC